jgi:hypothetical protein
MRALLLGFILLAAEPALAAEKYVGSNVDVRTILAFKVADAAVQKFLPQGWEPDVTTAGPAKDVNLRVTFIDRIVNQDAEGKALDPIYYSNYPCENEGIGDARDDALPRLCHQRQ